MATTGAYVFKLCPHAIDGVVADENMIGVGEWAWVERDKLRMVLMRDPDCKELATLWIQYESSEQRGHQIDAQGNVNPSVLHNWHYGDPPVERCGFHTQPTRLDGFVDRRTKG
jgi:hypothetical protein